MKNYHSEDLKNYKIMVLGVPGSGKTIFLASMYDKLSVQRNDIGFFLKADNLEQGKELARIYTIVADTADTTVADPKKAWPRGTLLGDRTDWHFTCCVDGANPEVNFESFHFTYFDYAGELLTDEQDQEAVEKFNNMIHEADVFLGILDGQKILEFMGNHPSRLSSDLRFILPIIQNHKKPVHFIITKWDLLENYSLRDILSNLEQIAAFKDLIMQRSRHIPIRVIPVSSVGIGFAELHDGLMQKKVGAIPHPLRVEIPLVCLLPDKFEALIGTLQREESRIRAIRTPSTATERMYQFLQGSITFMQWPVYLFTRLVFSEEFRGKIDHSEKTFFRSIKEQLKNRIETKRKQSREKMDSLDLVVNERVALLHTIDRFLTLTEAFEGEFPESLLKAE